MRKILLPWGGEMGIISLRCRVSAASGGASPAAGGGELALPAAAVLFCFLLPLYHLFMSCATRIGPIARSGKKFQFAWNRQKCPTWTFLFFCAIRPPADDGLPYRELFFLHTKPLPVVPPDMRAGRRYAPLPCSLCALALNTGKPPVRANRGFLFLLMAGILRPPLAKGKPAAAGFYGIWFLGLTPRRAGG